VTISDNPGNFIVSCLPIIGDAFSAGVRAQIDFLCSEGRDFIMPPWVQVADLIRSLIKFTLLVAFIVCPVLNFLIIPVCMCLSLGAAAAAFSKAYLADDPIHVIPGFGRLALYVLGLFSVIAAPVFAAIIIGLEVVHLSSAILNLGECGSNRCHNRVIHI